MSTGKKDDLFNQPLPEIGGFVFDEKVAEVFPDMINRSVPGYGTIIEMVSLLANRYAQPDSNCYDLGCSLGATSMAIAQGVSGKNCHIIAVDNSEAMLQRFRDQVGNTASELELVQQDVRNISYDNASFVALNFTLQFLPPDDRLPLLQKIYSAMRPGGCLVLSEKVRFESGTEDEFHDQVHTAFKRANGYSELEISQKRAALENVLIRETTDDHLTRLQRAGFDRAWCWYQCFNFVSMIAFRD